MKKQIIGLSWYVGAFAALIIPAASFAATLNAYDAAGGGGQACPALALQCPAGTYDTIISGCNHACVYPSTSAPSGTQKNDFLTGGAGTTMNAGNGTSGILSPFNTAVPGINGIITAGTAAGSGIVQNAFTYGGVLTGSTTASTHVDGSKECPILSRTLRIGAQGSDVTSLQSYLIAQGYLSANATGYYGTLTQQAVQAWQSAQGIVTGGSPTTTGFGMVGPMSRDRLTRGCTSGSGNSSVRLNANPTTGSAPLSVVFGVMPNVWATTTADTWGGQNSTLSLVFGDGASTTIPACIGSLSTCATATTSIIHTYSADGVYTAQLVDGPSGTNPRCDGITLSCPLGMIARPIRVVGEVVIRVGTTTASTVTMAANPYSGSAPLAVTMSAAGLTTNMQYIFQYGDGANSGPLTATATGTISASHTYANAGSYNASVQSYIACAWATPYRCMIAVMDLATTTVTVTAATSSPWSGQMCQLYMPNCAVGTTLTWTYNAATGCSVPSCTPTTNASGGTFLTH